MSKKNKTPQYILLVIMIGLFLCACTITVPTATDTPARPTPIPADNAAQGMELTWYMVGSQTQIDKPAVIERVNAILKEKINATLKLNIFAAGDEYEMKTNTALAAGEPIDIVFTANWNANYNINASSGYFTELNGYLDKYPVIRSIVGEEFLNASAINGKIYAVPTNKEKVHHWGYLLRKDLVTKYNMDVLKITSIESLEPYLQTIWENERQITPLAIANMDAPFQILDWDRISDDDVPGALYPDNGSSQIINHFLAPESIELYHLMRSWYNKGYIHQDADTMQNQLELMRSGRFFAASQSLKPGKDAEISASTGYEWVQVDITRPVMSNREVTGAMLAIPVKSGNPERAFRFIELLYTDKELINLLKFGIADVHYRKVAENRIQLTNRAYTGYNPGYTWGFGDQFKDYILDTEDPLKWDRFIIYNNRGLVLDSLGFAFDKTNVEAQTSACKNVVQAYYKQLLTGSSDVEATIRQFEKELKAAGVSDLIAEMQRQYDAWLAAKAAITPVP
ncbi:MAG: ABC transporter substrate-binding protein [Thermoclostridium sp.]|nr:ABC transporter substrate-binding protein [Thermoclostridium sp.]